MKRRNRSWGYKETWFPVWDSGWSLVRGHFNDFMWLQWVERTWSPAPGYDWMGGCCVPSCWSYRDPNKWPKKP